MIHVQWCINRSRAKSVRAIRRIVEPVSAALRRDIVTLVDRVEERVLLVDIEKRQL